MMSLLPEVLKTKAARRLMLAFLAIVFLLRIIYIDQDLPPWGVANYQPLDEGSYSILALNLQNYGQINPTINFSGNKFFVPAHVRVNLIGNVLSAICLKIFGDNYYGLRMPYVIFGAINFILFYLIINCLIKKYGKGSEKEKWISIIALFLFAFDFIFFIASRVAEPSMVRLLFIQLIVLVFLKVQNNYKLKFFLIGLLITLSVFLVYITNVFLYFACGILILYLLIEKNTKLFFQVLLSFISGCLIMLVICEFYYISVWKTEAIVNMFRSVFDFSKAAGYEIATTGLHKFIKSTVKFFSANSLLYNIHILVGFILSIPVALVVFFKRKNEDLLFLYTIVIGLYLQTIFSEDYIIRKFIIIYPVLIFIILLCFLCRNDFFDYISMLINNEKSLFNYKKLVIFSSLYLIFAALFCIGAVSFRLFIISDGTKIDFALLDKLIIVLFGLLPVLIALFTIFILLVKKECKWQSILKYVISGVLFCSLIVNSYFIINYVFLNKTYSERDAMIKLGQEAGSNYVLGEYEMGFSLYNNIKPVLDNYSNLRYYMSNNHDLLYFDYSDENSLEVRSFLDNKLFFDSDYTVMPIAVFERKFSTFGKSRNMALYKVVSKAEAIKYYKEKYTQNRQEYYDKQLEYRDPDLLPQTNEKFEKYFKDVHGNISEDINEDIVADVYGDIYGDVNADIYGDVYGNIYGNVNGNIYGKIYGKVYGKYLWK